MKIAEQGIELMTELNPLPLPEGISQQMLADVNGLDVHVLEAGDPNAPALLLLHGFPELAYSWRKVMLPLAKLGFHVIAPDQRGYGRTTGWANAYDTDLFYSRMPNLVRDAYGVLRRLGHAEAAHVIGHDFGASVAGWAGLLRPDVFRTITVMSAPFNPPPQVGETDRPADDIAVALAQLARPRKHYQEYYSAPFANPDMMSAPYGLAGFLRRYFHMKSADWAGNEPHKLAGWTAGELAKMPTYYIMDGAHSMPEAVADAMPDAPNEWLTDDELAIYAAEYGRTGFQGGLNWYRCRYEAQVQRELELFGGTKIEAPMAFIAGAKDWGVRQTPGALEAMEAEASTDYRGGFLIDGAGHWIQQEKPEAFIVAWRQAMGV